MRSEFSTKKSLKYSLDEMALVAAADDEVVEPVGRIDLHDVPENRFSPDLDEGLWQNCSLLADPRPKSASQNYDFHVGLRSTIRAMPKEESGGRAAWQPRPHRNSGVGHDSRSR